MMGKFKWAVVALVGGLVVGVLGALAGTQLLPSLAIFGNESENRTTQVIESVTRQEQVVLLSLGIQGISEESDESTLFGRSIPGTSRASFLQFNFDAKLGIDGGAVTIEAVGEDAYRVTIPEFIFIGHDNETFRLVAEDKGLLSWLTPETDTVDMINQILDDEGQDQYIDANRDLLMDQAKVFYGSIIRSVDPAATVTFDFSESR